MKQIILIITVVISNLSCSENSTSTKNLTEKTQKKMYNVNQYIFPEAKDITENNFVEKLSSQIKYYDKEPIYYFRINKQNCLIEIYLNDIIEHKDYKLSNLITPIQTTGEILKSGEQKVTVKMYPIGNLLNESWGKTNGKPMTELSENSEVSIQVISIDEKSPKGLNDEKEITKITSPKEAAGKNYYEFSFTFNADVPYQFEGWTKGQDLTKLDQDLVRKKALEFYQMVGEIHTNKDLDSWLKLNYPSYIRVVGSSFVERQYLIELLNEFKEDVKGDDYSIEPIKDFKMEYMGDRRLLRLKQTSLKENYRGRGALTLKFGDGGVYQPGIMLFLPEGRDLATQGFMMWK